MKLWPFSKKPAAEGAMDRTMDLPPGVVLASPDEPPPATLPMINNPSQLTQEGPLIDPALGIDQNAPEIDQIFGPMQASMPLSAQAPSEPTPVAESPMTTLPADLPDALFSDSAPALWLPPAPEAEMISPIETPSESFTWENLAPPDPMMDMAPPAEFVPCLSSPPAEATSMPMAQPMEQPVILAPVETANDTHLIDAPNDAVMLAPPSLDSTDLAPPTAEPASIPQAESMYYQPETTYMPADANFDPDPVPLNEMTPSMEMSDISMATMNDTAAFLPPNMDDTSAFDYIPPLESISDESMNPHAASYEAPMDSTENYYSQPESVSESSDDNGSFFVSTSFDAMDGFGQVNGNAGLFTSEDSQQAPAQDDLYLPPDADFGSLQLESSDSMEAGQAYVPDEAYAEDDYSTGEYSVGEYLTDETVMMDALNDEDDVYALDDMAIVEDAGDSTSYDLGHYDDPDAPMEAFVLGSDEPEPILSLDLETSQVSMESNADDSLSNQSALYYPQETVVEELSASFSAEEPPMPEPVQPMPARMPEPQPHPMSAALAEVTQPEPAKPVAAAPIPPRANPIQESAFRKSSTSHTPYSDSIADALQTFEQEVLLRDTRFLKQSINNLVERYFAQSEPENEW